MRPNVERFRFPEVPGSGRSGPDGLPEFETLAAFYERTKDLPPPSWLIEHLIPSSGQGLIASHPNAGKTWFSLVVAKAASAMGRTVLLAYEEGGAGRMRDRFRMMGLGQATRIHVAHRKKLRLDDHRLRSRIVARLRAEEAPVLVLDPFSSFFLGDENDTRAVNVAKSHIEEFAQANENALVIVMHHMSKNGDQREGGARLHAARGSSVLPGWADFQLHLHREALPRDSGQVAFQVEVVKMRDDESGQKFRVALSLGTGTAAIEHIQSPVRDRKAERVIEVLATVKAPLKKQELAKLLGGRNETALQLIDDLEQARRILRVDGGYIPAPLAPEEAS